MIWYCISTLSNNWNQFIMGEIIKLDRICNKIVLNIKAESKSLTDFLQMFFFIELVKNLLIVTTKWENALETSVDGWHGIYSMSLCITLDT